MHWLRAQTQKIRDLVEAGTPHDLTYAALECRLAIERVCYERLKISHKYISHKDLKKWQPRGIVDTLIQEVDGNISSSLKFYISKNPVSPEEFDDSKEYYEKQDYQEVGRQVGFSAEKLGKIWNSLGNFLHVRIPESEDDEMSTYGDSQVLIRKINEVLGELLSIERGNLIISGLGETVSFNCVCGTENLRKRDLLLNGKIVSCVRFDCYEKWKVYFEGDELFFQRLLITVRCGNCDFLDEIPSGALCNLERDKIIKYKCHKCNYNNKLRWKIVSVEN